MKSNRNRAVCGAVLGATMVSGLMVSSVTAATYYDSYTGLSSLGSGDAHIAEQISLPAGPASYNINNFTKLGIDWSNIAAGNQTLDMDFYSGTDDLNPTSPNALAADTLIDHESVTLVPPGTNGNYAVSLNFSPPLNVPDTFTLVLSFKDATNTTYSSAVDGLYTTGTLSAGADPGFPWVDSNLDGTFTGAEQAPTAGGASPSHILLLVDATAIPEPITGSVIFGMAGLALMRRRVRV
jgi:hypothetical protein